MIAKYFTAQSRETAEAMAAMYFSSERDAITFEVVSGGEDKPVWLVLAILGTQEEISNMDAGFGLYYEEDGVYLETYRGRGSGHPLDSSAVTKHVNRKNLSGLSVAVLKDLLASPGDRAKIAPAQIESFYGEDIVVEISGDEMEASAKLLAPEEGGAKISMDEAKLKIEQAGVTHGLDEQELAELLSAGQYGDKRVIARATLPVDGDTGSLIFHFSTDERTGRPREIGGGRVDYRSLDLYVPVTEGQLLVTRTLATEGTPGLTVKGRTLKHKSGKNINLPKGKNVDINEEKTEICSKCSGMVEFINNSVNVSSVYKIDGDCDISVGNIDFDGSVHVSGCVRSGNTIKATGGVVVGGVVEAAKIISGGNVEIKSGMQGAGKGRIESGGSVTILYVERGTVVADGPITVDVSIHSNLETSASLYAKGKRGAIIGGNASAAGDIVANSIGAVSNAQTEIEVGVMPRKRAKIEQLEKEMEKLRGELVKLDQLDAYLEKSKGKMDVETWDKLYRSSVENRRLNNENHEETATEIYNLKYELDHATNGRVHVFETAYAGTRITIASEMYKLNDEIKYATFMYKDGQITYGPCELSKT